SLISLLLVILPFFLSFFFNDPATTEIYTLSLHDALPISPPRGVAATVADERLYLLHVRDAIDRIRSYTHQGKDAFLTSSRTCRRSEEHTSELQSPYDLVCRLLLEKKKKKKKKKRQLQHKI